MQRKGMPDHIRTEACQEWGLRFFWGCCVRSRLNDILLDYYIFMDANYPIKGDFIVFPAIN